MLGGGELWDVSITGPTSVVVAALRCEEGGVATAKVASPSRSKMVGWHGYADSVQHVQDGLDLFQAGYVLIDLAELAYVAW